MVTRIDTGAANVPQAPTDTLAQTLKGLSANLTAKAQRALPRTTPDGTPGNATRAVPTQNRGRAQMPGMTPLGPAPRTEGVLRPPPLGPAPRTEGVLRPPPLGPAPRTEGVLRPPPLGPAPRTEGKTFLPAPRMPIPGNWQVVPQPNPTPRGETAPRADVRGPSNQPRQVPGSVSGAWFRPAPAFRLDLEPTPPRVGGAPEADAKGTGKSPVTPSAPVFTSAAQQRAFESVVHLTTGGHGTGSGVIVANKGNEYMLLTNQHCVRGKKAGDSVEFTLSDGTKVQGKIAALGDPKVNDGHDLAAITFTSTRKLTTAKLATTEPKAEQKTFSIGYPHGGARTQTLKPSDRVDPATGAMVAEGNITANRRDGEGQINGEYGLVTTSRVIQGMSGGGMFDAATGDLVAINGQSASPVVPPAVQDGIGFRQTVGNEGRSVGIAAAEVGQFLRQNKAALPDFARG